jgi:hypothetical protein
MRIDPPRTDRAGPRQDARDGQDGQVHSGYVTFLTKKK